MKKYKLREHFTIDFDGNVVAGPCVVELSDKQYELEKHKLELIPEPEVVKPKVKGK